MMEPAIIAHVALACLVPHAQLFLVPIDHGLRNPRDLTRSLSR